MHMPWIETSGCMQEGSEPLWARTRYRIYSVCGDPLQLLRARLEKITPSAYLVLRSSWGHSLSCTHKSTRVLVSNSVHKAPDRTRSTDKGESACITTLERHTGIDKYSVIAYALQPLNDTGIDCIDSVSVCNRAIRNSVRAQRHLASVTPSAYPVLRFGSRVSISDFTSVDFNQRHTSTPRRARRARSCRE